MISKDVFIDVTNFKGTVGSGGSRGVSEVSTETPFYQIKHHSIINLLAYFIATAVIINSKYMGIN